MRRIWMILKFAFYIILGAAMITALIMSFFDAPRDVPEFVWNMPRVY